MSTALPLLRKWKSDIAQSIASTSKQSKTAHQWSSVTQPLNTLAGILGQVVLIATVWRIILLFSHNDVGDIRTEFYLCLMSLLVCWQAAISWMNYPLEEKIKGDELQVYDDLNFFVDALATSGNSNNIDCVSNLINRRIARISDGKVRHIHAENLNELLRLA